ncbi:propionate catabolism operon regulatory protein PrpR [Polaromonas sp.]|uniref:propionate catabolism operon regulatory protein PrpR n=1 Tax=Polaromonas sp. TaxID=1869339 RepID=UPI00181FD2C8|nr:propionate catabolism operon regulatory protein PrpR [Polaromonas sp.]NMM08273.1 propionate catabolism operon regulatory protein PrpR [Polaromonas sp.]
MENNLITSGLGQSASPGLLVDRSRPVIWAVSGHRLVDTFRAIGHDFDARARIEVAHTAFDPALAALRQQIAQRACDVVVASGSNGAYLRSHLAVPVVLVKVGGYDLMTALCNARALSSRIAVVLHRAVSPELRRFAERFGIGLEFRSYETADDALYRIQELAALGVEVVVGAGMVADLAQRAGLAGVFLYSADSVRNALEDALAIALAQREEKSRRTQLDSVVRHLSDGVVAIDMAGRITTLNPAAARLVSRSVDGALGIPLQQIFVGLEPGAVLTQGQAELGRVDELLGRSLVVDCVPLHDAGRQTGAVFTLHAPGPLESAVGRLRAHSHRRSRSARYSLDQLVAVSPAMSELVRRCQVLARYSDATVLIQGESGSGKEVVAQGIHSSSRRCQQPFVATNCGAFPASLLESELFGYEEGAFTGARRHGKAGLFEAANGGTLFLDEIGEMPLLLQTRLLRALQEKEITRVGGLDAIPVDVRIVAATHRDLFAMVGQGAFREDLFYRLHILQVVVPPLRERPQDVEALAARLIPAALERAGVGELAAPILRNALPALRGHAWPGNVRELENVAERIAMACLLAGAAPAPEEIAALLGHASASATPAPAVLVASLPVLRRQHEAQRAHAALKASGGDRDAAALALGISRTTLWRKLR